MFPLREVAVERLVLGELLLQLVLIGRHLQATRQGCQLRLQPTKSTGNALFQVTAISGEVNHQCQYFKNIGFFLNSIIFFVTTNLWGRYTIIYSAYFVTLFCLFHLVLSPNHKQKLIFFKNLVQLKI